MTTTGSFHPRFEPGRLELSSGVEDLVNRGQLNVDHYLHRHLRGDWGDIGKAAREANEQALRRGGVLYSSYVLTTETKLMIVTADSRTETAVLLVPTLRTSP
ncbi:hypothetical protein GCM10011487_11750 [Steroidobacter agaridevorans]|uniref:Uncharacterized protein n=1 Tax=Steroidobacter agaridevorans TaxID=2695856 RepID=A0A829Y873_9GAMM|nr:MULTISPECIES: hypothetical protein [Steroidobacteraceae]GFE79175.1 hypothetical protein GCM10011487_11750 [Steroidobacter agaridevorans]